MRNALTQALLSHAARPELVFLTGDLGFMALEPLRAALGARFLNAGVAEQNMVSVAAGLAQRGLRPWVYSISPFLYARAFEQVRNDVCLHGLPVVLVGNGGGYAYGVMGATHHALEDYGALLTLPNLRAWVPAFAADVAPVVALLHTTTQPAYLRLGRDEAAPGWTPPPYAPWRQLLAGHGATVVTLGPLAGHLHAAWHTRPVTRRPSLWVVAELPSAPPPALLADVAQTGHLVVVEEHTAQGSLGMQLARQLLLLGQGPRRFTHRAAAGYPSGRYGSQAFHRQESQLDATALLAWLDQGAPA